MTTTPTPRIGNKAPDWGRRYDLNELWTEIVPGLWVGGTADEDTVDHRRLATFGGKWGQLEDIERAEIGPDEFDAVVTLYAWARPVDWGVEEYRFGFGDGSLRGADFEAIAEAANWGFRRWRAGKKVLFRCQAGLNRSSFIAALAMMRAGYTADEAIMLIRKGRSNRCLFNEDFEDFLKRVNLPVLFEKIGVTIEKPAEATT